METPVATPITVSSQTDYDEAAPTAPEGAAGVFTVQLGGVDRPFCMDLNALVRFQELTGRNVLGGDLAELSLADMRAMLFVGLESAALAAGDTPLTLLDAGRIGTLPEVYQAVEKIAAHLAAL